MKTFSIFGLSLLVAGAVACDHTPSDVHQGYVEGEYVYISSPHGGVLQSLSVKRGMEVNQGDALYRLDENPEVQRRTEAEAELRQAQFALEDKRKGKRPSEVAALEAERKQAEAAYGVAEEEYRRQERLSKLPGVTSQQDFERARSARDQAKFRISELDSELVTARLGARDDELLIAEAKIRAQTASLEEASWNVNQKSRNAPEFAVVFDTYFRPGEWVPGGRPVVSLLPPSNIKVRAFIPQSLIGTLKLGDAAEVRVDGVEAPVSGKLSFISPQAEFTPPIIYSKDSRAKFVFMIEIVFPPDTAKALHPGQPVDVRFLK